MIVATLKFSVATHLRYGGIYSNHFITNFPQNVPMKKLQIGQYFGKLWTKICGLLFLAHTVLDQRCSVGVGLVSDSVISKTAMWHSAITQVLQRNAVMKKFIRQAGSNTNITMTMSMQITGCAVAQALC